MHNTTKTNFHFPYVKSLSLRWVSYIQDKDLPYPQYLAYLGIISKLPDEMIHIQSSNLFFNILMNLLFQRVVQKLTEMVGRNITLYDMLLQFLRTLFLRTRTIHYCTLRAEMLMALHEAEVNIVLFYLGIFVSFLK